MIAINASVIAAHTNNISQSSPLILAKDAAKLVASKVLVQVPLDSVDTFTQSNDVAPDANKYGNAAQPSKAESSPNDVWASSNDVNNVGVVLVVLNAPITAILPASPVPGLLADFLL